MREIKFRAWDTDLKHWCYLAEALHKSQTEWTLRTSRDSIILMQFTGLKDKNGKEIYEGDLLQKKDLDKPRVVKWTDQNGAYFVLSNSATKKVDWDDCLTDERINAFKYKVIGNIYENKDLLKK